MQLIKVFIKISIESLAALYQSVDFTSNQLIYEDTILEFSGNNDILMSFYFQLVNIRYSIRETRCVN